MSEAVYVCSSMGQRFLYHWLGFFKRMSSKARLLSVCSRVKDASESFTLFFHASVRRTVEASLRVHVCVCLTRHLLKFCLVTLTSAKEGGQTVVYV